MTYVYVLNKNGKPLMPTCPALARFLLKLGRAKVEKREPFTIKLLFETTDNVQDLTLGTDPGSGTAGFAVLDNSTGEVVYSSQVQLRQDIKTNMDQRRAYRRNRRGRKTRYRKPRFLNRGNSRREGRLPPTIISKIDAHVRELSLIRGVLPIKTFIIENSQFDMHAILNPAVLHNKDLYQKGPQYGFENTKTYVLYRDGHTCQCCNGKSKDKRLQVHHKIFRSQNGKDTPDNLVVVCETCHKKIHDCTIVPKWKGKKHDILRHSTQVNVIANRLAIFLNDQGLNVQTTYGFVTKADRQANGLDKTHYNDAIAIALGNASVRKVSQIYLKKCVAKGDYQLAKGKRSEVRLPVGKINGFRKFDKVFHKGVYCFVKGRMSKGYMVLMDIAGKKIDFKPVPKPSLISRISARRSVMSARINPSKS